MNLKRIFAPLAIITGLFSQPAAAYDDSVRITNNVYYDLQNYARSPAYQHFQQNLVGAGHQYNEPRQQTRVFMNSIASGRFDGDFQAMVNLNVCASLAMVGLAKEFNLSPRHHLYKKAFESGDAMSNAIGSKIWCADCRQVFYAYDLR